MATTAILPEISKRIAYNRTSKDYDCYISIDGDPEQYIGSAPDYSAAEKTCNDFAFSYYEDNHTPEKAIAIALTDELSVTHRQVQDGGSTWATFTTGEGLTKVYVSADDHEWPGVHLIIGGSSINDGIDEIIALADLRQLRDNLTALLADERLAAALGELPTPAAPAVRVQPHICDDKIDPRYGKEVAWVDYIVDTPAGPVEATLSNDHVPGLCTDKQDLGDLADYAHWVPAITALLNHPDVKAALIRAEAGAPQRPIRKAA